MLDDVVVVVATYNERDNLGPLIERLVAQRVRVVVVDDSSPDGTGELADSLAERNEGVAVLHRPVKEGLGRAYADAFEVVLRDRPAVVCQMDADFSHDPAALPHLLAAVAGGADVAIGSRYVPGGSSPDWPLHRRLLSRAGNWYARRMLGVPVRDVTAGFRAFRGSALERLEAATCDSSGYAFQVEMARRAVESGLRVVEVPIEFRDRVAGESKMRAGIAFEAMVRVSIWGMSRWWARLPWRRQEV